MFKERIRALYILFACVAWVLAAPAQIISTFKAGDAGWHLGSPAVANLDNNPDLEIIVTHRDATGSWFVDAFKYNGQRLPGFPYAAGGDPINVSPTIADINNDGRNEILITRGNSVVALNSAAQVLWSTTVNSDNYVPDGGFHTVTNGFYWSTDGSFISRLPSTASFSSEVSPPVVTDLKGNGQLEVVTAWKIDPDTTSTAQDFNPDIFNTYGVGQWGLMGETWSGGVITMNAATGQRTFVYHMHHLVESGLAVGRANASGPLNIYELNDSDSVVSFDKYKPFGLWGKGMLHKQFGKNQRLMTGSYQYPVDIYAADIDGDGVDEVLVAGTQASPLWQPNETILDDDGSILWRRWLPQTNFYNANGWVNSASLIPCNPDHDNHADVLGWNHGYELSFRYWNGAELVDRAGWPKNFYPLLPTPPVVGDVDGDGEEEIVVGTYHPGVNPSMGALNIYALDGRLKVSVPVAGGIKHIPVLADVRNVGKIDVVYRSTLGTVTVQNFGSNSRQVSWATHRGNMGRDGNLNVSLYPEGTPKVTSKKSGSDKTSFSWTSPSVANSFTIYRSEEAGGPFMKLVTLAGGSAGTFTDTGLKSGVLYFYEVSANYGSRAVHSAPFTVLSLLNNNLLANSGFEECQNSHWDKWYTGEVPMTNMSGCTTHSYGGKRSMRVELQGVGGGGTISQFGQYGIPDSCIYVTPGAYYSFGGFVKSGGLSQPSEHWLEWGSAKTGYDTNNRPPVPWPNYFTSPAKLGIGDSEWVYMNRTFRMPEGFPNVELLHKFKADAPADGMIYLDNIFLRRIPDPAGSEWTSLLPFGSQWKYFWDAVPDSWAGTGFNDGSWQTGRGKFGGGGGPRNVVTALPQMRPYYYFRTTFTVPEGNLEELLLEATCTDDTPLQLFINGTAVPGSIDTGSTQGNSVRYYDLTPFAHLLRAGTNSIAARMGNTWADWDDVAFDISLKAVVAKKQGARLSISCPAPNVTRLLAETPQGTYWNLESSDSGGPWGLVDTFLSTDGQPIEIQDVGQNGRTPPNKTPTRLYRLVPQ